LITSARNEQQWLRHEINRRHRHRDQPGAGEAHARERVSQHHPEDERNSGGHDCYQHRVPGPQQKMRLRQQIDVMLQCRVMDEQRHQVPVIQF
jgi:hypothetical protein